jgi:hypothetical protein
MRRSFIVLPTPGGPTMSVGCRSSHAVSNANRTMRVEGV